MRVGYFAVSLPDFLIFNEDWTKKNKAHCWFLMGLGNLGLGYREKAEECFKKTLELDSFHLNCRLFLNELEEHNR